MATVIESAADIGVVVDAHYERAMRERRDSEPPVVQIGDDFVVLDDPEFMDTEELWEQLVRTLKEFAAAKRRRRRQGNRWHPGGRGREPGWGLNDDDLANEIQRRRTAGEPLSHRILASTLGYSKDTVKRHCHKAGYHGRLSLR